jgi:acetyl esterase/lipase
MSPQFAKLLGILMERRPSGDLSVEQLRAGMESTAFPASGDVTVEADSIDGVAVERISAAGVATDQLLIYLHGGGYVMGSPNTHRKLAADLSRASGAPVLLPDYPLAPEHPFPAAIDAVTALYESTLASGTAPSKVAIAGDSAGGGLTVATLLSLRARRVRLPAAAALLSPWVDLIPGRGYDPLLVERDPITTPERLDRMAGWYLDGADAHDPLASPIGADLTGLPPLLIQVGGSEILVDDARELAANAGACGVDVTLEVWPDMVHVWQIFAGRVPEATDAVARIGEFVSTRLS